MPVRSAESRINACPKISCTMVCPHLQYISSIQAICHAFVSQKCTILLTVCQRPKMAKCWLEAMCSSFLNNPWRSLKIGKLSEGNWYCNHPFSGATVDGRNPAPPGMYYKILKNNGKKLPSSTGDRRTSEPSTVCTVSGRSFAFHPWRFSPRSFFIEVRTLPAVVSPVAPPKMELPAHGNLRGRPQCHPP